MSKFCIQCGSSIPDDAAFCPKCGTSQPQADPCNDKVDDTSCTTPDPVASTPSDIQPAPVDKPEEIKTIPIEPEEKKSKKGSKKLWIILGCLIGGLLVLAAAAYLLFCRPSSSAFDTSLLPVKNGEGEKAQYGYVDQQGKFVIPAQFYRAYPFHDGLAKVVNDKNEVGYINKKGKCVIPYQYMNGTDFSEGLAFVVSEGEAPVCINKSGKEVFKCDKSVKLVRNFKHGLAAFRNKDDRWGYLNTKGKIVINAQFYWADNFSEGLASVANKDDEYGYINKKGKIVINYQFNDAGDFSDGMAIISNGDDYGYINKKGKYIINPQFEDGDDFIDGIAIVSTGDDYGIINKKGEYLVNPQFNIAHQQYANTPIAIVQNDKYGFTDKKGKIIITPQFDDAIFLSKDFGVVESGGKIGFINRKGKYVCNPQFDDISLSENDIIYSDYYDVSALLSTLFKGWDKTHIFKGIPNGATSGYIIDNFTSEDMGYRYWSHEFDVNDDISAKCEIDFDDDIKDIDWSTFDYYYHRDVKSVGSAIKLELDLEAQDHLKFITKSIKKKLEGIYSVTLKEKTIDDSHVFYSCSNDFGLVLCDENGDIFIIISFTKEHTQVLKENIEKMEREEALEDDDDLADHDDEYDEDEDSDYE